MIFENHGFSWFSPHGLRPVISGLFLCLISFAIWGQMPSEVRCSAHFRWHRFPQTTYPPGKEIFFVYPNSAKLNFSWFPHSSLEVYERENSISQSTLSILCIVLYISIMFPLRHIFSRLKSLGICFPVIIFFSRKLPNHGETNIIRMQKNSSGECPSTTMIRTHLTRT